MDFKLELIAIPVTDVDRAKPSRAPAYADHDHRTATTSLRQLTPRLGVLDLHWRGVTPRAGSVKGMQMVVDDIEAARASCSTAASRRARSSASRGAFVYFATRWQRVGGAAIPSRD